MRITSTLVRVQHEGLLRKRTKSRAGERTLALPPSAIAMLRRRFITGARLAWITSHTFRKTAATIPDEAALSARLVADQLGHARPSMTQDV